MLSAGLLTWAAHRHCSGGAWNACGAVSRVPGSWGWQLGWQADSSPSDKAHPERGSSRPRAESRDHQTSLGTRQVQGQVKKSGQSESTSPASHTSPAFMEIGFKGVQLCGTRAAFGWGQMNLYRKEDAVEKGDGGRWLWRYLKISMYTLYSAETLGALRSLEPCPITSCMNLKDSVAFCLLLCL